MMISNYKRLGNYIKLVEGRNTVLQTLPLMGLSITKKFIPSIANLVGTDMTTYRTIIRNQFAYSPVTSRNGDKITIALFDDHDKALISQAYTPFEVIDKKELLPEYLMMWFRRTEFDRYARFMSHGSARELFSWEDLCDLQMPIPAITKQKEIVKEYNVIQNRIALNKQLIQKLEETAQAIYKQWFVDFEFPDENGKPYKSNGGEMIFNEELKKEIPKGWEVNTLKSRCKIKGGKRLPKEESLINQKTKHPFIKITDMKSYKFLTIDNEFEYLNHDVQKEIGRYIVSINDVIISIVGATIGIINVIHESLHKANLTENCVKLTDFTNITSDFLYHFFYSEYARNEIEMRIVGGAQGKLPIYNIESIKVNYPTIQLLDSFSSILFPVNNQLKARVFENTKLTDMKELLLSKLATIEN